MISPGMREGPPKHFLQPQRAASTTQRSVCVKAFTLAEATTPTPAGESALCHVSAMSKTVTVVQIQLRPPSLQTAVPVGCTLGHVV